jgi:hypothetical protein
MLVLLGAANCQTKFSCDSLKEAVETRKIACLLEQLVVEGHPKQ